MEKTGTFRGPYTIVLHPDPEEGGFGVVVPSLPGVMAEGNSRDEAVAAASRAIEEYVSTLARLGRPIPPRDSDPRILVIDVTGLVSVWV
ncbi:MAG TPA: type II toxin-antitoxin system HicB family antitoxin [Chloroflexota bacterium]|nr:type II toxin-antitoxin system HicB family antitoxin [Chloroflexota bacterium]